MKDSFVQSVAKNIILERGARIELMVIEDSNGNENCFFVAIKELRYKELMEDVATGLEISPYDYGIVIYHGIGSTPPKEVEEFIRNAYSNFS